MRWAEQLGTGAREIRGAVRAQAGKKSIAIPLILIAVVSLAIVGQRFDVVTDWWAALDGNPHANVVPDGTSLLVTMRLDKLGKGSGGQTLSRILDSTTTNGSAWQELEEWSGRKWDVGSMGKWVGRRASIFIIESKPGMLLDVRGRDEADEWLDSLDGHAVGR